MFDILYDVVKQPKRNDNYLPVDIDESTRMEHVHKVLHSMKRYQLDILLVYADREHGANFAYLTGFEPRFEEAVCVLHSDGRAYLMLGNENLKMNTYSAMKTTAIHVPYFSLPNQPMENSKSLLGAFYESGIADGKTIGICGWKLFTCAQEKKEEIFDVPYFIVDSVKRINKAGKTVSAGDLFLNPENGVRICVNANEIAHYEFGAGLASGCVLKAMNAIEPGKTEMEIASNLSAFGQPVSVTTICATGERFEGGVVFPRNKEIKLGDKFSLTYGLRGGLTSRAGYVVYEKQELPVAVRNYIDVIAKPYYKAAVTWLEHIGIGVTGGELYRLMEQLLPRETYHWSLNPGHYISDEEWLSSPIYPDSVIKLRSGMLLQLDILPSVNGYGGANAEDGIAIADEALREDIKTNYKKTWERIENRRKFMIQELGIRLKPEILPLSDLAGYLRPFLLNKDKAFKVRHN